MILNAAYNWYDGFGEEDSNPLTLSWFQTAASGIDLILGHGFPNDLPALTLAGDLEDSPTVTAPGLIVPSVTEPEPVFPGDGDIAHGQYLYRPDNRDIDVYEFTLSTSGEFTVETIAERLGDSSQLDSVLRIYREVQDDLGNPELDANGNPVRELISQNDDYYSEDSFVRLNLGKGRYFVGVSASGNDTYNPNVEDSGIGGTSEGEYKLRFDFRPDVTKSIVDTAGTPLDGDADGRAGGVYNFWFRATELDRVLEITGNGNTIVEGQTVTIVSGQGQTKVFEFDSDGTLSSGSNVRVTITRGANPSTATQIAAALTTAIIGPTGFNNAAAASATGCESGWSANGMQPSVRTRLGSLATARRFSSTKPRPGREPMVR